MRFSVRFFATLAGSAALALCAGAAAQAQSASPLTTGNGTYISVDPLSEVRYDNRYDVSLGMAYDHMKAGPTLLQGANLGGLDLSGSYWLTRHWGVEGSTRYYLGTSGAAPNSDSIDGPFVSEYFFTAGPEWLGPHNKHGALIAHVLFGGVYGNFEQDLRGHLQDAGFYNNQLAPAAIIGGHMDLNRSAHWVFRITPDAVVTRYGINYGAKSTQTDVNFALSVGVQYKFSKRR
jgi:opacity protein-like surface antigen